MARSMETFQMDTKADSLLGLENEPSTETTQLLVKPPANVSSTTQRDSATAANTLKGMIAVAFGTGLLCTGGSLVVCGNSYLHLSDIFTFIHISLSR